jgi:PAS domain S-box-containing protein
MTIFDSLSNPVDTLVPFVYSTESEKLTEWLSSALRSISDAVIASDTKGGIQYMNLAAEVLTGWSWEEAQGRDVGLVFDVIDTETRTPVEYPITRVLRGNDASHAMEDSVLISRSGTEIPIDESIAPIRGKRGEFKGVVVIFRDITKQVLDQKDLVKRNNELQAQNEELLAFAHTVAHNLKNPLNLICGFAEMAHKECTAATQGDLGEHLQIIAQNGLKMGRIIDELLLLAGVRQADVNIGPLSMASIVAEVQNRLSQMLAEHRATVVLPPTWPVAVGYAPWVEEVWVNYLSNGIKYGGQPPNLQLGATSLPDGMIRFWIKDNGHGLTPEDQAQLFTPFTQLGHVRANGHGLGLSIVQRIVKRLNGQVGVTSQVGIGSTFTFTLPGVDCQYDS